MRPRRKTISSERQHVRASERLTDDLLHDIVASRAPESFLEPGRGNERDLSGFLNKKLEEKDMRKSQVIRKAGLNETFGYQIFSGDRHAGRDKVLALGFALGLDLHDMNLLLNHADCSALYSKNRRDAIIIFCVSHGYDLLRTDEELYKWGEATVSDAGED